MASDVAREILRMAQTTAKVQVTVMFRHSRVSDGRVVGVDTRCTMAPTWVDGRLMIKSGGITLVANDDKEELSIVRAVVEDSLQCKVFYMTRWPLGEKVTHNTVVSAYVRLEPYNVEDMVPWRESYDEEKDEEDVEQVLSKEPFARATFRGGDVVSDTTAKVLAYMKLARHAVGV